MKKIVTSPLIPGTPAVTYMVQNKISFYCSAFQFCWPNVNLDMEFQQLLVFHFFFQAKNQGDSNIKNCTKLFKLLNLHSRGFLSPLSVKRKMLLLRYVLNVVTMQYCSLQNNNYIFVENCFLCGHRGLSSKASIYNY